MSATTFTAVLRRDLVVTTRELPSFLAQVLLQPLFLLFIFGRVLTDLGYVADGFVQVLFPGIVVLSAFVGSLQNTALPLVVELSFSKELEDRLMAPMHTGWLAVEKMLFGAFRGLLAGLVMVPLGLLLLEDVSWAWSGVPLALGFLALAALAGATIGMVLGTVVSSRHIGSVFAVAITPIIFTGSTQFPLEQLEDLRWFQVVCALNPLTYASEGARGALVPDGAHLPLPVSLAVLVISVLVLGAAGVRGFVGRTIS